MGDLHPPTESREFKEDDKEDEPFPYTELDRIGLAQKDEDFKLHTWEDLRIIIGKRELAFCCTGSSFQCPTISPAYTGQDTNKLDVLTRKPSDLRRYTSWCRQVKKEYGGVSDYVMQHRLPWGSPPFTYLSSTPLAEPADYKILLNDWPYGFTDDITHIVVWSKTPIATEEVSGDVTPESRRVLSEFVKKTFVDRLGGDEDRVLWFKNWVHLQSVRALEHFHVLVRHATKEELEFWTGEHK
ncbi:hypothetical protein HYALB_00010302 [Hymenoscyphus albidus]|uniref:N-acetylglucosamine-induced protein 1 n=1 Tax=Hymenoscyphus albidus TaxID=595503 RepID=A0A9N9M2Y0_9HELO|nr:hypothetical protein HYALB_00010302 [Hymenoscyphus albidus]